MPITTRRAEIFLRIAEQGRPKLFTPRSKCTYPTEMAAAKGILGECQNSLPARPHEHNAYMFGCIRDLGPVLVFLGPQMAKIDKSSGQNLTRYRRGPGC